MGPTYFSLFLFLSLQFPKYSPFLSRHRHVSLSPKLCSVGHSPCPLIFCHVSSIWFYRINYSLLGSYSLSGLWRLPLGYGGSHHSKYFSIVIMKYAICHVLFYMHTNFNICYAYLFWLLAISMNCNLESRNVKKKKKMAHQKNWPYVIICI